MSPPVGAIPQLNELTAPFWEAAKEGRLVIQRCGGCGYYNHPPKPACDRCQSADLAFADVSGLGLVWSFTVMHQKSVAGFEESVPYVTALVELDEQALLLMVTNLPGTAPEEVRIGARVRVTFEALEDGLMLPQFVVDLTPQPLPAGRGGVRRRVQ